MTVAVPRAAGRVRQRAIAVTSRRNALPAFLQLPTVASVVLATLSARLVWCLTLARPRLTLSTAQ
jgi:hypothetical protein